MKSKVKGGGRMEDKSKMIYDGRRKELTQIIDSDGEAKNRFGEAVGKVTTKTTIVHNEEDIRKIIESDQKDIEDLKKLIKSAEERLENINDAEETEEIKKWMEIQQLVSRIRKKEQLQQELEGFKEKLKITSREINKIKETIGSRLKL